jgi:hypothetical protein
MGRAQLSIALERTPDPREVRLAVVSPTALWCEVSLSEGTPPLPLTITPALDQPLPAWQLEVAAPSGVAGAFAPRLEAWWLADAPPPAAATIVAGRDFHTLDDLAGRTIEVANQTLRIEDARVDSLPVPGATGDPKPCLCVTWSGSPDAIAWLRIAGADLIAHEHRHYAAVGRYVARFWLPDAESAITPGVRWEITTLDDLKHTAERYGTHARFDAVD